MGIKITAISHENKQIGLILDKLPNLCPICRKHIHPAIISSHLASYGFRPLYVAFICPVDNCHTMFVASYRVSVQPPSDSFPCQLANSPPLRYAIEKTFPESIQKISLLFCKSYNQALQAEENNLDQICGSGYRKALEYLIKDYLIFSKFKGDEKKKRAVLQSMLGKCIKNYVDDDRVKAVAERAAWLGNDETHYYRKWTDKDLDDLKTLISMTANWIDLVVQSSNYIESMPEPA